MPSHKLIGRREGSADGARKVIYEELHPEAEARAVRAAGLNITLGRDVGAKIFANVLRRNRQGHTQKRADRAARRRPAASLPFANAVVGPVFVT
jgi:hypothetical protein